MRIMGLQRTSENVAWTVSTFIDLAITFFICMLILLIGEAIQTTSRTLLYLFLLAFGAGIISFW